MVLLSLPEEVKGDVTKRISSIKNVNTNTLHQIEKYIKNKIGVMSSQPLKEPGGMDHVAAILKGIVPDERKKILDSVRQNDAALADEITKRLDVGDL